MNKQEIRKALNVPKDLRICEHIYNVMREYEKTCEIYQDVFTQGIDIFYVEDEEFISKLK
tara:strand:+ start:6224 stop:6403 length:180 start_codon:yes stop_codon:yes gene_type:complete